MFYCRGTNPLLADIQLTLNHLVTYIMSISVIAGMMVGTLVFTISVVVPNFTIWPYNTRDGRLFTFITSIPSVTLVCSISICGGDRVMVSTYSRTDVDLSCVVFAFKFATLGPYIFTAFLTHSLLIDELSNKLLSIICSSAFVVRPAVKFIPHSVDRLQSMVIQHQRRLI